MDRIPIERLELFLNALRQRCAQASERFPTVRLWKRSSLIEIIGVVVRENAALLVKSTFPSATEILAHLQRIGWIHPIEIEVSKQEPSLALYLMDMETNNRDEADPLELLQAFLPDGVLCYFSALTYYELTTQVPTHYHIARLVPRSGEEQALAEVPRKTVAKTRPPVLGQFAFSLSKVPCYWTKRQANRVVGIQMRAESPRTWFRITNPEQTLLDTLLQPLRCGGAAVVLEAWQTGYARLNPEILATCLAQIPESDLQRRVGAILDLLGAKPTSGPLVTLLREAQNKAQTLGPIPLLKDLDFPTLNRNWNVLTP